MLASHSLIPELEEVLHCGTPEKHGEMLRQITTLFLQDADRFNEDHIRLFDDVFGLLIEEIETKARAELSVRLAPVGNAPIEILRRLAKDDDISVAGPVLSKAKRLPEADLVDIAKSKGQAHLFAISARPQVTEAVSDVLVSRGDRDVVRRVAENPGVKFSESGYARLVNHADKDSALAEAIAVRADIPDHLFRELLLRATEVVQRRLLAAAKPETQAEIRRVLAKVSDEVGAHAPPQRNFDAARKALFNAAAGRPLGEQHLAEAASAGRYEETVAALSELCDVPTGVIDKLMTGERPDPILILCKAANFAWSTARAIILARPGNKGKSSPALEQASVNFDKLSGSTAKRVVRFWQLGQGQGQAAAMAAAR